MASPSEGHNVPEGYHQLSGSERPRSSGSRYQGPLDLNDQVSATLVLRRKPDAPSLPDHQHWDNTPLAQRQFLSPQQYAESYGASQADIDAVIAFVSSHGLKVLDSHAGRRTVAISGDAAQINAAFGIQLNQYETPRPEYRSRAHSMSARESALNAEAQMYMHHGYDGPVHIPDALAGIVIAVIGLDNRAVGGPGGSSGDPAGAKSLAVATVAGLYNFPNSGAADQVIGVIAPSDPVGTSSQRLSGYLVNDINSNYFPNISNAAYRTAPASLNDINLTVGTNTYSNSTATVQAITSLTLGSTATGFAMEVTQDISTAATIAQGAAINVYFTEITEQGLLVCLNRILLPEGESQPTVVTCSFNFWGSDETGQIGDVSDSGSAAHQMSALFQALALVGVGVFIISQDRGSNDGDTDGNAHVCYPGSDPWVTSVGGTVIGTVNPGPPVSFAEVVWSNAGSTNPVGNFGGASGGGPSQNFPVPSYQSNAGITSVTDSNGNATNNKRCIPDVAAMVSYSGSGANDWFFINGLKYNFTGTSCACPLLAGLYAVLRSAFGVPLGFFNPTIYQIGGSVCNDITSGNNDPADSSGAPFYNAAAGWDPCTGWGSIDGTKLLNGIAGLMYNVALASNGGVATASSQYSAAFPVAGVNNNERAGVNWGNGGGWNDSTSNSYPDWVEIDFNGSKTIDHVVVYTVQDNWQNPIEPTDTQTFSLWGVTDFTVQGWNGSAWVTLASVSGNNLVKRTVNFASTTTSRIRINVTNALASYSRITEIEVWGVNAGPAQTNVALASNGGVASASSTLTGIPGYTFPIASVNDNERAGVNWGNGGGWNDGTFSAFPDWVEIDFNGSKTIDHVVVYTVQDNWQNPIEPTDTHNLLPLGCHRLHRPRVERQRLGYARQRQRQQPGQAYRQLRLHDHQPHPNQRYQRSRLLLTHHRNRGLGKLNRLQGESTSVFVTHGIKQNHYS